MQEIWQEQFRNMVYGRSPKECEDVNVEDVNVERRLSVLKQVQGTWLVEVYAFSTTSAQGKVHVLKGWKKVGIKGVVTEREVLPLVELYQEIYTDDS